MKPRSRVGATSDWYDGVAFSTRPTARSIPLVVELPFFAQRTSDDSTGREHDPVFGCELDCMSAPADQSRRFGSRRGGAGLTDNTDGLYHEYDPHELLVADPADDWLEQETA